MRARGFLLAVVVALVLLASTGAVLHAAGSRPRRPANINENPAPVDPRTLPREGHSRPDSDSVGISSYEKTRGTRQTFGPYTVQLAPNVGIVGIETVFCRPGACRVTLFHIVGDDRGNRAYVGPSDGVVYSIEGENVVPGLPVKLLPAEGTQ